jgi:hypothetical protein
VRKIFQETIVKPLLFVVVLGQKITNVLLRKWIGEIFDPSGDSACPNAPQSGFSPPVSNDISGAMSDY